MDHNFRPCLPEIISLGLSDQNIHFGNLKDSRYLNKESSKGYNLFFFVGPDETFYYFLCPSYFFFPFFPLISFSLAVDCGPLSVPANGSSLGAATVFPNSQHFICDPGFILNGSALRTCQPNGTWSGFTTTCSGMSEADINKHGHLMLPTCSF